jgi:rhamnose transport system permease protein
MTTNQTTGGTPQVANAGEPAAQTVTRQPYSGGGLGRGLRPWLPEVVVALLLILAFVAGALLSPYFLDAPFLFDSMSLYMEMAIMALGMTLVIISGNIDLSVAGNLALVACVSGVLNRQLGVPMGLTILLGLALGAAAGCLNGLLIARLRLPALAVTLATMALFRGMAQILLGDHSLGNFPKWFVGVDQVRIPGTPVALPLILFLVLAAIFGLLLHRTVFGRWVYALGTNEEAAHFSGVPVARVKILIFTLMGLLAGMGGLMMDSRLTVARFDHATGLELDVITAVVLGGTSISGGRGTIIGTLVAIFLVGFLRTGMGVANVKAENQLAAVGTLLIVAVIASNLLSRRRK